MLGRKWAGVPRGVRFTVAAEAMVFAYGAAVHVIQLVAGGLRPYQWAPTWLAIYFTSLTLADPLAAALLWTRRASGLYLGGAVLVTDALANGYATYALPRGGTTAQISQAIISLMAIAVLASAPRVRPWLSPDTTRSSVRRAAGYPHRTRCHIGLHRADADPAATSVRLPVTQRST